MTGPEHYREAEKDIELANNVGPGLPAEETFFLARAQVHATLAAASATAMALEYDEWKKWSNVGAL